MIFSHISRSVVRREIKLIYFCQTQINCGIFFLPFFPTFFSMSCRLSAQILALVSISEEKVDKRMDMGTNGFYGDTFDSGFGSFETAKRRYIPTSSIHKEDMLAQRPRLDIFLIICTLGWFI